MRRLHVVVSPLASLSALSALSIVAVIWAPPLGGHDLAPPIAKTVARIDTLHGDIRNDNYFWIRERINAVGMAQQ